jgi:FMN phosphatase YigB (HAD superfamily)
VKVVLFDLGNTLEYTFENRHVVMPGALILLSTVSEMKDGGGDSPILALISDFLEPPTKYYHIIQGLGIDKFFKPYEQKITLSNDVGVSKPDTKIFRAAVDKIQRELAYHNVIFVTENKDHITEARRLGMMTIRFKFPNDQEEGVNSLLEMIPLIQGFVQT